MPKTIAERRASHLPALALCCFPLCAAANDRVRSVCDLARDAPVLNGQSVRVLAVYETDLLEFSGLSDANCPGVVMDLDEPRAPLKRHRSIEAFDRAVTGEVTDVRLRRFEIEFTGTFHWDSSSGPRELQNGLEAPRGSIEVRRIWTFARWRT
jgi:hypothetical protein